jgi:transposase
MSRLCNKPNAENASLQELQKMFRIGTIETQRRCMGIIMLLTGSNREQVCRSFEITDRTLRNWVFAFNTCGIDGLINKKRPGAPKKIDNLLSKELREYIEQPQKVDRTFWTAKAFYGFIQENYAVECNYKTVVRFFHEQGYSLQVPRPWPDRQDEQLRKEFINKLKELCSDQSIDIWYGDETGVDGDPKPRRRWAPKGSKPTVVHNGDHIRMSITGIVCPRTGEFFGIEVPYSDTEIFQIFLNEAAKRIQPKRPRNILIVDNATWHKRKSLNWHSFEPMYLPPYSPDLNPIERIWLVMKAKWFNNIHCKTVEELMDRMDVAILDLINNPLQVAQTTAVHFGN